MLHPSQAKSEKRVVEDIEKEDWFTVRQCWASRLGTKQKWNSVQYSQLHQIFKHLELMKTWTILKDKKQKENLPHIKISRVPIS